MTNKNRGGALLRLLAAALPTHLALPAIGAEEGVLNENVPANVDNAAVLTLCATR
jgi:hypothetical protein